jgi:ParB family chromosome partitioning protein
LSTGPDPQPARRGLGRGLEVLLGGLGEGSPELAFLSVDEIHANPRQPRRRFEPEAHAGLAESIRSQGVVQPLLVRPRPT